MAGKSIYSISFCIVFLSFLTFFGCSPEKKMAPAEKDSPKVEAPKAPVQDQVPPEQ